MNTLLCFAQESVVVSDHKGFWPAAAAASEKWKFGSSEAGGSFAQDGYLDIKISD